MIDNVNVSIDPNDDSKLIVDFTFQPVRPVLYINMDINLSNKKTWRDMLRTLYLRGGSGLRDDKRLEIVAGRMQQQWPGPYIVEEFYNARLQGFDARLKFEDPKQETMWKIRNE